MRKRTHYYFAHKIMPSIYYNDNDYIIDVLSQGKEQFIQYLLYVWEMLKNDEKIIDFLTDIDDKTIPNFEVFIDKLNDKTDIAVVIMPEAKEYPEAISFAFTISKIKTRFYTYELGTDNTGREKRYFVCGWTKEGQHLNFGSTIEPDIDIFIKKIDSLLLNQIN